MYRKERRIPTIIGLLIILAGIGGALTLSGNYQNITSKASDYPKPSEVHFSNISDNSITISYLTDSPKLGSVQVTGQNKNTFILDDLDYGKPKERMTHMFTLKNLEQNSKYKIKIASSLQVCKRQKCPEFIQKTGVKLIKSLDLPPLSGQIIDKNKQPVESAIIYLLIGNAAPVSGRSDRSGMFIIPLNNLRNQDLLSRPDLSDESTIQLTIKNAPDQYASVLTNLGLVKAHSKMPTIEIGKTYNFLTTKLSGTQSSQAKVLGNRSVNIAKNGIDILFPRVEMDTTIDQNPKIRGIGIIGNKIKITLMSETETAIVTVKSDGTWEYRPKIPLSPGRHTITITGVDNTGKTVSISRDFVVLKSGESVLGEATPSGTLTPTETPVTTPPTGITVTPEVTSTPTPSPTPTLTPTPIETPTPTPSEVITTIPPRPGNAGLTNLFLGGGVMLVIVGIKLLL